MKHQMLIKSFLLLAMFGAIHSAALASEVIGNLSSGGGGSPTTTTQTGGGNQNTGEPSPSSGSTGTPNDGSIAGSVSGGSSSNTSGSGSGGSSGGQVLGEQTMALPARATQPSDSSASRLSQTTSREDQRETGVSEDSAIPALNEDPSIAYATVPVPEAAASAFGAFSQFSTASWFWIIALSLLLVIVIAYIYNHEKAMARTGRLKY